MTDTTQSNKRVPVIPQGQTQASGFNAFESLLILAPILLYGIFNVYRSQVNPKAKLSAPHSTDL